MKMWSAALQMRPARMRRAKYSAVCKVRRVQGNVDETGK